MLLSFFNKSMSPPDWQGLRVDVFRDLGAGQP